MDRDTYRGNNPVHRWGHTFDQITQMMAETNWWIISTPGLNADGSEKLVHIAIV
jgi:hypothetical protein